MDKEARVAAAFLTALYQLVELIDDEDEEALGVAEELVNHLEAVVERGDPIDVDRVLDGMRVIVVRILGR